MISKTDYQLEIIARIRRLRAARNVGQVELAEILDVSNGQIGNIESPKFSHKYTLKQLYIIATHFGVTLDHLLTGSDTPLSTDGLIQALIRYDE